MAGPWEEFQANKVSGPWEDFAPTKQPPAPSVSAPQPELPRFLRNLPRPQSGPLAFGREFGPGGHPSLDEGVQSGAFKLGGAVTDVLSGAVPPEIAGAGGFATNLGLQLLAGGGIGKVTGAVAKPVFEAGARKLMQSAVKPIESDLRTGKASRAIDTLLKEDVSPTPAGMQQLQGKVSQLNEEIESAIKNSKAMVNKARVGAGLRKAFEDFRMQVNPDADVATIRRAWEQFKNHPLLKGRAEFPVQTAQTMKRATDRSLGSKAFGELKGAETEAQKGLRFGLKEEISRVVPEVSLLNKTESELLNAMGVAERRALQEMNKNPLGLAALASNKAALVAFLADKSASFKAFVARQLFKGSSSIPGSLGFAAAAPTLARSGVSEENQPKTILPGLLFQP